MNEFYHDDFLQRTSKLLQDGEFVQWAGNYTDARYDQFADDFFGLELLGLSRKRPSTSFFGYSLVTTNRMIEVLFQVDFMRSGQQRKWFEIEIKWFGVCLPTFPLTPDELQSRRVREMWLSDITRVDRSDDNVKMQGVSTTVVSLVIHITGTDWMRLVLYILQDGQDVYDILIRARRDRDLKAKS